jgi:meso-butanediol dehydrogenase/(S,S)-butanediol dehydrogenase/diacetyl reductase
MLECDLYWSKSGEQSLIMYEDLKGKVAIVTGSGSELGIGQSIARRLSTEGANLVLCDLQPPDAPDRPGEGTYLHTLVQEFEAAGGQALAVYADVTRNDQIKAMVAEAMYTFNRIDILVNNAGAFPEANPIEATKESSWDITIDVSAKGAFLCSRAVIPHLKEVEGGRIVNISSIAGKTGHPTYGPYNVAKGAVILLTQTVAREVGEYGITVNAVCPGNVDTLMGRKEMELLAEEYGVSMEEAKGMLGAEAALGRMATPEDIANAVAFLCSDQASFITGQSINVCGGIEFH